MSYFTFEDLEEIYEKFFSEEIDKEDEILTAFEKLKEKGDSVIYEDGFINYEELIHNLTNNGEKFNE